MAQKRTTPFPKTTSNLEKMNPGRLCKANFEGNSRAVLQRCNANLEKTNPDRRPPIVATGRNSCTPRTAVLAGAHSLKKLVCLRVLEKDSRFTRRFLKRSYCLARQVLHRARASLMKQKGKSAGPQKDRGKGRVVVHSTEAKKSMQTHVGSFKCLLCRNAYNCTRGLAAHGRRKHSGEDYFKWEKCGMILAAVGNGSPVSSELFRIKFSNQILGFMKQTLNRFYSFSEKLKKIECKVRSFLCGFPRQLKKKS
jgi:hypothetical protein